MTIFLPKGLRKDRVVDPNDLYDEFSKANSIAEGTSQYQWAENSFVHLGTGNLDKLQPGGPVKIHTVSQKAYLRGDSSSNSSEFRLLSPTDEGFNPELSKTTGDPELFHIPYNRGFHRITGTQDMEISWVSEYPELIFSFFSFQYARKDWKAFYTSGSPTSVTTERIRAQIKLMLNGAGILGSGLHAHMVTTNHRGLGYGSKDLRTTIHGVSLTPAGSHTIEAKAAQAPSIEADDDGEESAMTYLQTPPDEGVCIAHRTLTVVRFPRGGWMGE